MVERAHVVVASEGIRHEVEPVGVDRAAVQAKHGRTAFGTVIEIVELQAVRFDEAAGVRSRLYTSIAMLGACVGVWTCGHFSLRIRFVVALEYTAKRRMRE